MMSFGSIFNDSLIKKLWSGSFLTASETSWFLAQKGFDHLYRGIMVFKPKIKFRRENILSVSENYKDVTESQQKEIKKEINEYALNKDEIGYIEDKIAEIISNKNNIGKIYKINDFEELCDKSTIQRQSFCILPSMIIEKIYSFLFKTDFQLAIYFKEKEGKDERIFLTKEKKIGFLYFTFPSCFSSIIKKIINNEWLEKSDVDLFIKEKGFDHLPCGEFDIQIKFLNKNYDKKIEKKDKGIIKIKTKAGLLFINSESGEVKLNNIKGEFNPTSVEFKTLLKIATSEKYIATYENLLGEDVSKVSKKNLTCVVRNIKEILKILPKKRTKNKDCIENIKGYGYKLIT